jgi:hypothetical protein
MTLPHVLSFVQQDSSWLGFTSWQTLHKKADQRRRSHSVRAPLLAPDPIGAVLEKPSRHSLRVTFKWQVHLAGMHNESNKPGRLYHNGPIERTES